MPFINIKLHAGRDEATLMQLAKDVGDAAMKSLGITNGKSFTIAVQPVDKEQWDVEVATPEIAGNPYVLVKGKDREDW